jgi:ubiquitin carboxyl-terminal hydrolase 25/28
MGRLGKKHEEIQTALAVIQAYKDEMDSQVKALEKELEDIESDIKAVFNSISSNNYHLHAILVHEGGSENGHYYAFIFDRNQSKWYRFNDYKVTEETTKTVFSESFGQHPD